MNIIEVCAYYPPHNGGIEFVVAQLAEALAAQGHEVQVLTSTIGARSAGSVRRGRITETYMRSVEFAHTTVSPALLWRLVRAPRTAVIHVHLSHVFSECTVWVASFLRRQRYVAHYHMDVDTSGRLGFLYRAYKRTLLPLVMRRARMVIALSEEQRSILVNRYGVDASRAVVIPNGVSEKFFLRSKRGFSKSPKQLLFVGRFALQKNVARLIDAVALMKTAVELHLVGGGELEASLRQKVAEKGLHSIIFHGFQDHTHMVRFYEQADVFVLPSRREGMPLVLLEAAAAGLPIVASNVQGIREFVSGNGVLVDGDDGLSLAHALDDILARPTRLQTMSQQSSEWASAYTWDTIARKIAEVLVP